MFIIIVFRLGCDRRWGLLLFVPAVLFSVLAPLFCPSSSVSLSYFILAVPMRECLRKHSCMSSLFPVSVPNGTSLFLSLAQEKLNMPSGHYHRHCFWSGRSNQLIKLKLQLDRQDYFFCACCTSFHFYYFFFACLLAPFLRPTSTLFPCTSVREHTCALVSHFL